MLINIKPAMQLININETVSMLMHNVMLHGQELKSALLLYQVFTKYTRAMKTFQ